MGNAIVPWLYLTPRWEQHRKRAGRRRIAPMTQEPTAVMRPRRLTTAAFLFSVSGLKVYTLLGGTLPEPLAVAVDWTLAGVVVFCLWDLVHRHYKARATN